jgi:ABC-type transport system involved in multi-copper enzyme maturation permease subunit
MSEKKKGLKPIRPQAPPGSTELRIDQLTTLIPYELQRNFLRSRVFVLFLLAALPVVLMLIRALFPHEDIAGDLGVGSLFYAVVFQTFIARFVVFFGCLAVFTELFRSEMADQTLHYYFQTPMRREVLVVGKFISGLLTTIIVFSIMVLLSYALLLVPHGQREAMDFMLDGPGMNHLLGYMGATWLACVGYGAIFMALALFFKNPVIPAGLFFGWEWINFFLPELLKKISVVHYLESLMPIAIDKGPFALIVDPSPIWVAVPGLLALAAISLVFCALAIRRMQIRYESS